MDEVTLSMPSAPAQTEDLLEFQNVSVRYGGVTALSEASLRISKGEIVAIMGPNGAGKTTVLRALLGLAPVSSGAIYWQGRLLRAVTHEMVTLGIAFVPQGRRVFSHLTVQENLEMGYLTIKDASERARRMASVIELFPALEERRLQIAGTMSGGQQQMVAIARALMSHPKLLVLDEPTVGLAPIVVQSVFDKIEEINRKTHTATLFVEHDVKNALDVAHRIYIIDKGLIIFDGEPNMVREGHLLKDVFLGKAETAAAASSIDHRQQS